MFVSWNRVESQNLPPGTHQHTFSPWKFLTGKSPSEKKIYTESQDLKGDLVPSFSPIRFFHGGRQPLLNLGGVYLVDRLFSFFFSDNQTACRGVDVTPFPGQPSHPPRGLPCESGNVTQVQLYDVTKAVAITQVNQIG